MAGATFPGENGQIAYANGELKITTKSGRVVTTIRAIGPAPRYPYVRDPRFLADGERLVYSYGSVAGSSNTDIWVSRTDGTAHQNLTPGPAFGGEPTPSPDGEIAFVSRPGGSARQALFVMEGDGTDIRQITPGETRDERPSWSPDGDRIVFARTPLGEAGYVNGPADVYAVDPDGSDLTKLADGGEHWLTEPSFTPDGDHVLFLRLGELQVMNEDGTNQHPVEGLNDLTGVVASPDAARFAISRVFQSNCDMWECDETYALFTSATDGTQARRVVDSPSISGFDWGPLPEGGLPRPEATCQRRAAGIVGTPFTDEITGTRGPDVIAGLTGRDSIAGAKAGDLICAGEGRQVMRGYRGGDVLIPGPGRDPVYGHMGGDTVSTRDGDRDRVHCGAGRDVVVADSRDVVATDCETVRRSDRRDS